jgi:uncharacterized OB-fold protein
MSARISVCDDCGKALFPPRLLCPRCGSPAFHEAPVHEGTLEDLGDRGGVVVGMVRVSQGPILIARVLGQPRRGQVVSLDRDGDIPVARG